MDWIERWFGVSPDNGDGSLEWLIVCVAIIAGVTVLTMAMAFPRGRPMLFRLFDRPGSAK
jgi:hypothetical protein